jgi:hypothetical protein
LRQTLRPLLLPVLSLLLGNAHAASVSNATELRDALRGNAQAVALQDIPLDRGCGPMGCVIDIAELRIQLDQGQLQRVDGKPLHWQEQGKDLPELDWSPLSAYRVSSAGKSWGICLEFTHSGVGKSGAFQRWGSLVLVPFDGAQPGPNAYRLLGYWSGCDSLQVGSEPGQVRLPIVSQKPASAEPALQLLHYHCDANGCQADATGTPIREQNGALQLPPL